MKSRFIPFACGVFVALVVALCLAFTAGLTTWVGNFYGDGGGLTNLTASGSSAFATNSLGQVSAVNQTISPTNISGTDGISFPTGTGGVVMSNTPTINNANLKGSTTASSLVVTGATPGTITFTNASGQTPLQLGPNDNVQLSNTTTSATVTITNGNGVFSGNVTASKFSGSGNVLTGVSTNVFQIGQQSFANRFFRTAGNVLMPSNTAYFTFIGKTTSTVIINHVFSQIQTGGAGSQVSEIGLFTTITDPNGSGLSFTKLVSTGNVSTFGGFGTVISNTTAFAQSVPIDTYLWAGIRCGFSSTQPTLITSGGDKGTGNGQSASNSGLLTGAGPWTGVLPAYSDNGGSVDLWITTY
jgi:hypothetical protein